MITGQIEMFDHEWSAGDPRDPWRTPERLWRRLDAEFGFRIDLASSYENRKTAAHFTEEDDTLSKDWSRLHGPCFCNPPFSDIPRWVQKAAGDTMFPRAPTIVMLLPANRTDQAWFHKHVIGFAAEVRLIAGRVQYVPPPGIQASSASFGSMLVVYRPAFIGLTTIGTF